LAAFRNASRTSACADAVSALLNLGFRPAEANAAVAAAEEELGAGASVANLEAHFAGHAVPGLLG
jgi:Holliday junction DNA helicase RuvA